MEPYVVVDIETTGTQPLKSDIIEIGAVYVENGKVVDRFERFVRPTEEISPYISSITGITWDMVANEAPIEEVIPAFVDFCKDAFLVGHNLYVFDYRLLKVKAVRSGLSFEKSGLDTLLIARKMLDHLPSRKLKDLCTYYGIDLFNAHRAYADAYATYELLEALKKDFSAVEPELFKPTPMQWEIPKVVPMTAKQKKYLLKLLELHNLSLDKEIDTYSKSEASKKIDQIIRDYGNR